MKNDKNELYHKKFFAACKQGRLERIKHYIQVKFSDYSDDERQEIIKKAIGYASLIDMSTHKHIETFDYLTHLYKKDIKNIIDYKEPLIVEVAYCKNLTLLNHLLSKDILNKKEDIEKKVSSLLNTRNIDNFFINLLKKNIIKWDDTFPIENYKNIEYSMSFLELVIKKGNLNLVNYIIENYETDLKFNMEHYLALSDLTTKSHLEKHLLNSLIISPQNSINTKKLKI